MNKTDSLPLPPTLNIRNLAQIKEGTVEFGDFTLIVGPQASGKSIFTQLLKLMLDKHNIASVLRTNGFNWGKNNDNFLELYFGESMSGIWQSDTEVSFENKTYKKVSDFLPKQGERDTTTEEALFYVPAQRVVTMAQGWPRNFGAFDIGDPYVLKSFSETLRLLMERDAVNENKQNVVFPRKNTLKDPVRNVLNDSIFHGGQVTLDKTSLKKRFLLRVNDSNLPFMNWSAGQKEFMPLLLSLYHLMPSSKITKKEAVKWVVIEEPEMGLHPRAIEALMVAFIDLVSRGYKVVITTHSTVLIELAWAMNYIKKYNGTVEDLFKLFGLKPNNSPSLRPVFETLIREKIFHTYYFDRTKNGVHIKNISILEAGNDDEDIDTWGGLSAFSNKAAEVIAKLVNHAAI